ncbi:MAG: hypothetical protein ABT05_04835 [Lautropia sp. SCN 66-9]|nr:MAG: hypothetical protein ABT05_04835 [Lautropia sp. SCN 66-9]
MSAASAAAEIAARAAPRVLIDDWGRRIELPGAPARIVSLAPHATELLFAAGLGERLVAVDRNSDFPPQAARLPKLAVQPQPDIERLMALRPDLVVVWGSGTREALPERLQAVGIRVFVSEPHSLDEVGRALARFGDFGSVAEAEAARAAARRFAGQLALLRSRFSQRPPVRVFVQVWSMPLIGLSDRDLVGDLLQRIALQAGLDVEDQRRLLARSFFISADMAHAWHPNFPAAYEPCHRVQVNAGPVIKSNANQRYSTGADTAALFMAICEQAGVPCQQYAHRTDLGCGSTIGPIVAARLGIPAVDVGAPMWAMHSARESAGVLDHHYMIRALSAAFSA